MQMTEDELRQRMMAEMMRRGMTAGMGGEGRPQEFREAPQGAAMDMDVVPIELMKDQSKLITGKGKKKPKPGPDNPNADILNTHGYGGDSVGGDASPSNVPPPNLPPTEQMAQQEYMELPDALRKKRRWWQ